MLQYKYAEDSNKVWVWGFWYELKILHHIPNNTIYLVSDPDAGHIVKREIADQDEKEDEVEEEALFRKRFSVPKDDDDDDEKRMADGIKMEDSDRLARHLTVSRIYLYFETNTTTAEL